MKTLAQRRAERAVSKPLILKVGPVAQRLEQGTHNPLVGGSNPSGPTKTPSSMNSSANKVPETPCLTGLRTAFLRALKSLLPGSLSYLLPRSPLRFFSTGRYVATTLNSISFPGSTPSTVGSRVSLIHIGLRRQTTEPASPVSSITRHLAGWPERRYPGKRKCADFFAEAVDHEFDVIELAHIFGNMIRDVGERVHNLREGRRG